MSAFEKNNFQFLALPLLIFPYIHSTSVNGDYIHKIYKSFEHCSDGIPED